MTDQASRLRALDRARRRVALALSGSMILLYFGFIALVAFGRPLLGVRVSPGLGIGILLGNLNPESRVWLADASGDSAGASEGQA
jgi:uncharacterized membrane protein (DUF485 family)